MDKNELEKYKQEMMKLYGKSRQSQPESNISLPTQNTSKPYSSVSQEVQSVDPDAPDDTAYAPHIDEEEVFDEPEDEFNSRYPEPDLSELDTNDGTDSLEDSVPPEYVSEESMGASKGYILVNVRIGEESAAVAGATVTVTAIVDGKRLIIASGVTDENGTTRKFEVPAPEFSESQTPSPDKRPYSLYDINVTAEGFFNARSVDVPVFSGITSVQNFSLIPLPLMMDSAEETVTYFNQEPDFADRKTEV